MVANRGCDFLLIVNASRCAHDLSLLRAIDDECDIELLEDRALLALQGPASERVLASMFPEVRETRFMDVLQARGDVSISRSGYTGEDGFEISLTAATAPSTASRLLADPDVAPAGLGARDTLRLEAGLCLYGADLDAETSPVEAGLSWAIPRVRRPGGDRAGEYPGSERIERELANGPERRRIGLLPEGRAPMRSGTVLFEGAETDPIGSVTSGAYGPSLARPVSMGYVQWSYAEPGRRLAGEVRGRRVGASVVELPFVPANFKR